MQLLSTHHPCAVDEMPMLLMKLLMLMGSDMSLASSVHKLDCCMQRRSPHLPCAADEMPMLLNKLLLMGSDMSIASGVHTFDCWSCC